MRVGVFGGTFDPIHFGHLAAVEECRVRLALDKVLVVPAAQPPHKLGRQVSSSADRLAMLELALRDNEALTISHIELEREGPSYTVDTLACLRENLPPASELFFLVGLDALRDLLSWHEPKRILQLARLAVVARPGYRLELGPILDSIPEARQRIIYLMGPALDISSTDIRARVAEGLPIRYQLPDAVVDYIVREGLYAAG